MFSRNERLETTRSHSQSNLETFISSCYVTPRPIKTIFTEHKITVILLERTDLILVCCFWYNLIKDIFLNTGRRGGEGKWL